MTKTRLKKAVSLYIAAPSFVVDQWWLSAWEHHYYKSCVVSSQRPVCRDLHVKVLCVGQTFSKSNDRVSQFDFRHFDLCQAKVFPPDGKIFQC